MNNKIEYFVKIVVANYFHEQSFNVLEAGTAQGNDSRELCVLLPNANIYGFEPDSRYHFQVHQNTSDYRNFSFCKMALSDKPGTTKFYQADRVTPTESSHWGSSSIFAPKLHKEIHTDIKFNSVVEVETTDIDSWAKENNVDSIGFMWLDLQGAEYDVLRDCKILDTTDIIFSEVSLVELYDGIVLYDKYKEMLDDRGFEPLIEQLPWEDAGNVLFVRKTKKNEISAIVRALGGFQ
tara:strand:- start:185 stop:892 length:708 start_codon:yes stop_codon:yes gene_type:complete